MASTFNLVRNSRVFFTTNVDSTTGQIILNDSPTGITAANTKELTVLDGFSFSQGTQQSVIQISEAGNIPVRGQRAFNTQLDPVDFSFSTYLRPAASAYIVSAEEEVLWNALFSANPITTGKALTTTTLTRSASSPTAVITCTAVNMTTVAATGDWVSLGGFPAGTTNVVEWEGPAKILSMTPTNTAATAITILYAGAPATSAGTSAVGATAVTVFTGAAGKQSTAVGTGAHAFFHTSDSNRNQLQKFGMYFYIDNILYTVDNCALDQASIDFGLDGIATIAWSGKGTRLRQLPETCLVSGTSATFTGAGNSTGTATAKASTAHYITNKLSTMTLNKDIYGGGTSYTVALTGGNLTIANNINYVVPANLGVVNESIGYFTGSRSVSGNVTAYLRTGSGNSAQVLKDILTDNLSETKYKISLSVGGASNGVHADFKMNGVALQVPTVETGDVMSTTINFTAQGHDPVIANNAFDLEQTNDLFISYYATNNV